MKKNSCTGSLQLITIHSVTVWNSNRLNKRTYDSCLKLWPYIPCTNVILIWSICTCDFSISFSIFPAGLPRKSIGKPAKKVVNHCYLSKGLPLVSGVGWKRSILKSKQALAQCISSIILCSQPPAPLISGGWLKLVHFKIQAGFSNKDLQLQSRKKVE